MAELPRPTIRVRIDGIDYAPAVQAFTVISDLREPAVTAEIAIEDLTRERGSRIQRAMPLTIGWGYAGGAMTELFQGVVRDADAGRDPLRIRGIDYNTILAAKRITATYQDESAEGIVQAVLAESGITVDAAESGIIIDRLPLFNVTLRQALDTVTSIVRKQTGQAWYDYIRDGVLHWGPLHSDQDPVHAFRTGVDILTLQKSSAGLTNLRSLIVPVRTADVITVDDDRFRVIRAEYRWRDGGRTVLGLEAC